MNPLRQARKLLAQALGWSVRNHHPARAARIRQAQAALGKPAPRPYAHTTRDGHTLDQLTNYALYAMERRLGYALGSLTVLQGSYNAGGVKASAGTHDGGGAVDLTPAHWREKVKAARDVGFAAWHRPAIPGLWGEHVHMILIGNARLSSAARDQVAAYRAGLDGLAGGNPDPDPYRPDVPPFRMPANAAHAAQVKA